MASTHALRDGKLVVPAAVLDGRGRRRGLWALGVVLFVVLACVWALLERAARAGGSKYRTVQIERRTVTQQVEAAGRLDVAERIDVTAPVPGQLATVVVRPGARVKRGEVLGRLREEAAIAELRRARAELGAANSRTEQVRTELRDAIAQRERVERLQERGLASRAEVAAALGEEASARAESRAAEASGAVAAEALRTAELERGQRTLTAPVDGIVLVVPERRDAVVSPETGPVFVIAASLASVTLRADVAEADIGQVRVGQPASFSVPAFPGRQFPAVVRGIQLEGARKGSAVSYPVLLEANDSEGGLLPGMTATVYVRVSRAENVLAVREAALRFVPEKAGEVSPRSRVYVVEARDALRPVAVEPGLSDGAYTEIRVKPGTVLVEGDRIAVGFASAERRGGDEEGAPGITLGKRP